MSEKDLSRILSHLEGYLASVKDGGASALTEFFEFLVASEDQAIALINLALHSTQPAPLVLKHGTIEAGFVLYWIHYPPDEVKKIIAGHRVLEFLLDVLQLEAPRTRIDPLDYARVCKRIEAAGIPWADGTLIGVQTYEQLDPKWAIAAFNYLLNLINPGEIAPFPNNAPYAGTLAARPGHAGKDPVLGIVGDWGSGEYTDTNGTKTSISPSQRVMNDIRGNGAIDYLLHLGDVYYAGTDWRPIPGEEWGNFSKLWPDQGAGRNFTLNSNHEMYGDASGYFGVALAPGGAFGHQNGMSYFSLTYGKWLVLGLDSGYYSDAANGKKFYMDGAVGTDQFAQQIDWLRGFRGHAGPIMVLSHHNPCDFTGDVLGNTLWQQVTAAIGMPAVWYFGHVHNGVVYSQLKDGAAIPFLPTRARCCGHGAIPFGKAWDTRTNIDYYAHTPDPVMGDPRVLNGYATVTLHADGGFDEAFYEAGNASAVYSRQWTAAELAAKPQAAG